MSSSSPSKTSTNKLLPALHHALSGSAGTLISTCMIYPLSLVVTRLQVQRQLARTGRLAAADEYAGIVDAFSRIWRDGDPSAAGAGTTRSIAALYTGLTTESTKSVLDSFLFFLFYEVFRARFRVRRKSRGRALAVLEELAIGVAAGACSRAFTTPIANVVTRKQTGAMVAEAGKEGEKKEEAALGVRQIMGDIVKEKGVLGLWAGYSATLVLTLNPGITFFLQEFLTRSFLGDDVDDEDEPPGPVPAFLLAAVSKAVASAITFPFQTAKARLQAGVPPPPPSEQGESAEKEGQTNGSKGENNDEEDEEDDDDDDDDSGLSATRAVQGIMRQSVFGTIAHIARKEGVGALYGGIHGELLKAFFSHGTTMLAKGVVHKLLFRLYLVVAAKLLEVRLRRRLRREARNNQVLRQGHLVDEIPRALTFRNLDVHNKTLEMDPRSETSEASSRSKSSFSKVPSLVSRLITSVSKTTSAARSESHPTTPPHIILNIQDRSHRVLDED